VPHKDGKKILRPRPSPTNEDRRAARANRRERWRRHGQPGTSLVTLRMGELFDVFNYRYGAAPLPDDDAGRDDIKLMFQVLSTTTSPDHRMVDVADTWAPWLPPEELAALVDDVVAHPRRFKADTIAARLGITNEIRIKLDLRTIGAIDKPAEQRAAERREKQRLAKEQKRRADGVITIAEARNIRAAREPWRTAGISRATWYRRRQKAAA
jgi:hypothetical protein